MKGAKDGSFKWVDQGDYLTSTCHIANCVHGLLLAAEHGKGGEAYFVTDGDPVKFRSFVGQLLESQGVDPAIVGMMRSPQS